MRVEIHRSARRHQVDDEDIVHAVDNALVGADLDDEDRPIRTLVLGPDRAGNLLEIAVLDFDDGRSIAINAMKMTDQYRWLLPPPQEPMT